MRNGQLSIHSENILPIIKQWLYSEREIFVRELASNAADALQKLSILHARGEVETVEEPKISITIDKENKTLTFSDTGIGLDATEAEKFLSQIAFSGAEEFIKTYQQSDTFIGHFGLGFFSAFMVADKVEVISRSYKKDAEAICWKSDGSSTYSIEQTDRKEVGTDVILHIGKESEEFLEEQKMRSVLQRFCTFFPYPVYFNDKRINEHDPLWQNRPTDCSKKEYIDFFNVVYPFEEPPLFWVHINVDYPFHVKGILYFPRIRQDIEPSKNHVKLFCNRVFVSDDCKDILPDYLVFLKGVLDSPDIPLNVSRSHLQVDKTVRQLAQHISKKVLDALFTLFQHDRKQFEESWEAYELVIKLGILQDPKFATRAKDLLIFKTTTNEYLPLEELGTEEEGKKTVIYCEKGQEHSPLINVFVAKGISVIVASSPLDHPLMAKLERDGGYTFKRIDSELEKCLIDQSKEKTVLDASGKTEAAHIADFFRTSLSNDELSVEAKSLSSEEIPAMLTMAEEERRFRDYMSRMSGGQPLPPPKASLIVNTNTPLIQAVYEKKEQAPEPAKQMAHHVWDLTRLAHKELTAEELHAFTERSTQLLEELAKRS